MMNIEKLIPSYSKLDDLVQRGDAEWGNQEIAQEFCNYFDSLPWKSNRIDFDKIPRQVQKIDLNSATDEEIEIFLQNSSLSNYDNIAFVYHEKAPLLISKFNTAKKIFADFLTYPGDAMGFGFNILGNDSFDDFFTVTSGHAVLIKK